MRLPISTLYNKIMYSVNAISPAQKTVHAIVILYLIWCQANFYNRKQHKVIKWLDITYTYVVGIHIYSYHIKYCYVKLHTYTQSITILLKATKHTMQSYETYYTKLTSILCKATKCHTQKYSSTTA